MKTLDTITTWPESQYWVIPGTTGTELMEPDPIKLTPTRDAIQKQRVGLIGIAPAEGRSRIPAKFVFAARNPCSTEEGIWLSADIDDIGYPGATAATLGDWPRLWQHPESTLALQFISTLITGVGRARLTKSNCWESVYHWISGDRKDAKERFESLASTWKSETAAYSDVIEMVLHPAYQKIIGMGAFALPFIFEELADDADHWYHALHAITGANPIPDHDLGFIDKMRWHWLRWGRDNGFA